MGKVSRRVLGISPEETSFARRGFRCDSDTVRERLEDVGRCFVLGYLLALEIDGAEALASRLDAEVAHELRGFAYEGAGMALSLLDFLAPWRRGRLQRLLAGPGWPHVYIVHIGAGWALARLPVPVHRLLAGLDPLLCWLALDGYGFHQGFFHWQQAVLGQLVPRRLTGYARRAFDQGVGRSLWFVEGADPARIAADVGAFPAARRPDLWAGVGLACCYAGGVDRATLAALRLAAGPARPALAQGVAFAAKARLWGGNPTADTALACAVVCGGSVEATAAVTDRSVPAGVTLPTAQPASLPPRGSFGAGGPGVPPFEIWRQRIQQCFSSDGAAT
ncbi:MAG TPA: DUF1702 family protein [Thermoanaerobaculia bacterium]|nr:DUF1702 family protein [Thermoanaerobaculia bacterium]